MIVTNDVRIVFLRLMGREPTDAEIDHATQTFDDTSSLETYIKSNDSYKDLQLDYAEYTYDQANDSITSRHINPHNYEGVLMSNGLIGFVTSHQFNKCDQIYIKHNEVDRVLLDVSAIDIRKTAPMTIDPLKIQNHKQHLCMADCRFSDTFELRDTETGGKIDVRIDKYPLQTIRTCLVQQVTLESDQDIFLDLVHILKSPKTFNQYILWLNNNIKGDVYEVTNNDTVVTTVTHFVTPFLHKSPKRLANNVFEDPFEFMLTANQPMTVYIVSSCNVLESKNTNRNILRNLFYNSSSGDEIVSNHINIWRNSYWSTNINVVPKDNLTDEDVLVHKQFEGALRRAVFMMYTDISNTAIDNLLFGVPVLIFLKPNIAQSIIEILIKRLDPTNMFQLQDHHATVSHKLQNMSKETFFIYSTATLCVHIWNLFRTTVNRNWLINTGYPAMHKCCNFLVTQAKTHNTLVDYMVSMAFHYMYQTMYELNYVQSNVYPKTKFVFDYMNDIQDVEVTGTTLRVYIERYDDLDHFAFYAENGEYLGYKFGGTSGYKLKLQDDTVYTFEFKFSLKEYPIHFRKKEHLSDEYVTLIVGDVDYELYIPISANGVLQANSKDLLSYGLNTDNSNFNTFHKRFDTTYGANAFSTHSINNIIKPFDGYQPSEPVSIVEPYVLFNSYYNSHFFQGKSPLDITHKMNYANIVEDNLTYFTPISANDPFNALFEAGLCNAVSQYAAAYTRKRAKNIICYHKLVNSLKDAVFKGHWMYDDALSPHMLFVIITSLFEITVVGEIQESRIMVVDYGITAISKQILPEQWRSMTLANMGMGKRTFQINNTLLIDTPFDRFADALRVISTIDPSTETVRVELDTQRAFKNGVPAEFDYYVYLQAIDDTNDYTDPAKRATLLSQADLMHNTSVLSVPYNNAVPETIPSTIPISVDANLPQNRVLHFIYNRAPDDSTFDLMSLPFRVPTEYHNSIYPTVEITIAFNQANEMLLYLAYNSLSEDAYLPFTEVNLMMTYNGNYIDATNLTYHNSDNSHVASSDFSHDPSINMLSISIVLDQALVSSHFPAGHLTLGLVERGIPLLRNVPIGDLVNGMNMTNAKLAHITNPQIYPPAYTIPDIPKGFNTPPVVLTEFYNTGSVWYHAIASMSYCSAPNTVSDASHLLQSAQSASSLISLVAGDTHLIGAYNDHVTANTPLTFYAFGGNSYGQALVAVSAPDITTVTACDALAALPSVPDTGPIIYTTTRSTIVLLGDSAYGIGYNESYNLGTGASVNTSTLTECILINALLQDTEMPPLTTISMNDKATLLLFGDATLYALGEHAGFAAQYTAPTSLDNINTFLDREGYSVARIDTGRDHFKLLLFNVERKSHEWWGFGGNTSHAMGLDAHIDADTIVRDRLCRLHALERFIHGSKYDPEYTGPRVQGRDTYQLVRSEGVPADLTVMVDTFENRVFAIGTFDANAGESVVYHTTWGEVFPEDGLGITAQARFYAMYRSGFLIGSVSSPPAPMHVKDGGTATSSNETPASSGPHYYDVYITGEFGFQAALTEIDIIDSTGSAITISQENISDLYSGNGFLTNVTDVTPLFDGVPTSPVPLEYYQSYFSGMPPASGYKIFTIEMQLPVSQVRIHYNNWGSKPDSSSSWSMRVENGEESATISDFGDFVTSSADTPAIITLPSHQ